MKRRDVIRASAFVASGAALAKVAAVGQWLAGDSNGGAGVVSASALPPVELPRLGGITPVLPQKDSYVGQLARAGYVQAQKLTYVWTERYVNAQGIPLVETVMPHDLPSADWLLKLAGTLVNILVNFITAAPGTTASLWQNRLDIIRGIIQSAQETYNRQLAGDPLDPLVIARVVEVQAALSGALASIAALITEIVPQLSDLFSAQDVNRNEANYRALFSTIPLPEFATSFHEDDIFAYLRVGGQNPMLVKGVSSLPDKFPLTNEQYRQVMGPGDDLSTAGLEHRLYLLDYVDLGLLATNGPAKKLLTGTGYSYAPIALFVVPKGGTSLVPVAIQCGQEPANYPIFLPAAPNDISARWAWEMAKSVVQCAEENYHEMFVHLSRTHLVSEAFAMATYRNLAKTHPLYALLAPHFEGTLFINEQAALILLPSVPLGFINTLFAAPISDIRQEVLKDRLAFDFYQNMLPVDLANRKVDNSAHLVDYPYRDDGLLIWNAIASWAADYVNVYYRSDADVVGDYELYAWVNDVATSGKIKGFKAITSRMQLSEVLTMIIFTASAQHAAVNFSQPPLTTYAPAVSALLSAPAPTNALGKTQADWNALLPPMISAVERVAIYEVLGGIYHRPLGTYVNNVFPHQPLITDSRVTGNGGPLERFRTALKDIENTINLRNRTRTRPYEFLLPSRIPASTNI
ncbi:lipoxygenase family protein [Burkholderia cepacia]|uniref:lipoxygenase family protein n=1 Tax=Burkholderia cepacia TaxID=292 RepID=UPI002AB636F9|nr:lipoxygenase family protein [Burkholderia cepacia]